MPNSPVSLPTDERARELLAAECHGQSFVQRKLREDCYRAHNIMIPANVALKAITAALAMEAARPKEQVEGRYWPFANSGIRCVGFGKTLHDARNNVVFAFDEDEDATIDRVAACLNDTLSQPSSPEVIRAPDGLDESHYRGRAEGVPVLSNDPKMEKLMRQAAFSATEHKYDIPSSNEDALAAVEALAEDIRAVVFSDMGSGNRDGVLKLATELYCLRIANTLEAKPVDGEGAVEKVARAICEAGTEEPGLCFRDDDPHEAKCVRSCVACRNVARSVLEALSLSRGITLDEARERYAEEMQRGFGRA